MSQPNDPNPLGIDPDDPDETTPETEDPDAPTPEVGTPGAEPGSPTGEPIPQPPAGRDR